MGALGLKVVAVVLAGLPSFAVATEVSPHAELKTLGNEVLKVCGRQPSVEVGLNCFKHEIGRYFPSIKTERSLVPSGNGGLAFGFTHSQHEVPAERMLTAEARTALIRESKTCEAVAAVGDRYTCYFDVLITFAANWK